MKKYYKRILSIILPVLLIVSGVTGCKKALPAIAPVASSESSSLLQSADSISNSSPESSTVSSSSKTASSAKSSSNASIPSSRAAISSSNNTTHTKQIDYSPKTGEMRGLWVATAWGADFPQTQGAVNQQNELRKIVDSAKSAGLNTIIFQVRAWSDAMYKSSIYPWSAYLTGKQGNDPGYDPLGYLISYAHQKGLKVHAWVNPYRIYSSSNASKSAPCSTNPSQNTNYPTIQYSYSGHTYRVFDPSSPSVRYLITSGVTEIVKNYNVDGIQFDDYFYPYVAPFTNIPASIRRANVDTLINQVHTAIHLYRNIDFGVSPSGIWQNFKYTDTTGAVKTTAGLQSYSDGCADSKKWIENGWVDYICPQIYWGFGNTKAPFAAICDWWAKACKGTKVKLYIGLSSNIITGGKNVFINSSGINEIKYARGSGSKGIMLFHSAELNNMLPSLKGMF